MWTEIKLQTHRGRQELRREGIKRLSFPLRNTILKHSCRFFALFSAKPAF